MVDNTVTLYRASWAGRYRERRHTEGERFAPSFECPCGRELCLHVPLVVIQTMMMIGRVCSDFGRLPFVAPGLVLPRPLSLSLSHTHAHTHTHLARILRGAAKSSVFPAVGLCSLRRFFFPIFLSCSTVTVISPSLTLKSERESVNKTERSRS